MGRAFIAATGISLMALCAGCGGGDTSTQGSSGDPGGPTSTTTVGQVKASFSGTLKPLVTASSSSVNVTGISGATFSTVETFPTSNLDQTFLAMVIGNNVWTQSYPNGSPQQLTASGQAFVSCSISKTGMIAFDATDASGNYYINLCKSDGSGLHALTTPAMGKFVFPVWSPDGTKLSLLGDTTFKMVGTGNYLVGNHYTILANGTGLKKLTAEQIDFGPAPWSPDGLKLAIGRVVGPAINVCTMPSAGGALTNVTPHDYITHLFTVWDWSLDGQSLGCSDIGTTNRAIVLVNPATPQSANLYRVLTPKTISDEAPAFSPDSRFMIARRFKTDASPGGFFLEDTSGLSSTPIVAENGTVVLQASAWSRFYPSQTVVGTGGVLGPGCSGFLVSQVGDVFSSLVSFTANTASTAVITPPDSSGSNAPLVFTIKANAFSQVSWINGYFLTKAGFTVPTGTTEVLISFDSTTGKVNLAAPAASIAPHQPASTNAVTGKFLAVYDGAGKNIAPKGATQLILAPKTGKLSSWH